MKQKRLRNFITDFARTKSTRCKKHNLTDRGNMNAQQAKYSFRALHERLNDRDIEISQFDSERFAEFDDDADGGCLILDLFYKSGGSESILNMCYFTRLELKNLWAKIRHHIVTNWNIGRGMKTEKPKDVFFHVTFCA